MNLENKRSLKILINEASKFKRFDEDTQRIYIADYRKYKNTNLLHKIVNNNLLFVISRARSYIELNLPIEDMVNEGVIGLIDAIDRFDLDKKVKGRNIKFLTYAGNHINRYIRMYINDYSLDLHIPHNIIYAHYKVNRENDRFYAENGYLPDKDTLIENINKKSKKKYSDQDIIDAVIFINNIMEKHKSKLNKNEENDFDKFEFLSEEIFSNNIKESLKVLNNIEEKFILDFYGFNSKIKFSDMASKYSTKYKNIREIHDRIISKMKNYNKKEIK